MQEYANLNICPRHSQHLFNQRWAAIKLIGKSPVPCGFNGSHVFLNSFVRPTAVLISVEFGTLY